MHVDSELTAEDHLAWVRYAAAHGEPYRIARRRARRALWRLILIGTPLAGVLFGVTWHGPPVEGFVSGVLLGGAWGVMMGAWGVGRAIVQWARGGYAEACVRRARAAMRHGISHPRLGAQRVELAPEGVVVATAA